jgi:hypothetical protein
MADKRSYTAGHFLLSLDGEPAILKDVDGGNIKGEVVTINVGPDNLPLKHISTLKFEPYTVNVGMSMGKSLYDWIRASFDKALLRKNGYVAAADFNYKAMSYRHFRDALITEVTIPALDASSKDSAYFTIKFEVEETTYQDGDNTDLKGTINTKQKKWLTSNFRLELGDLPCGRVTKIDSFTLKQTVVQDDVGSLRVATKEPGKIEVPNLKVTYSASDEKAWQRWFEDFVVRGDNGQEKELNGRIVFLDPSTKDELGSVDLFQVGIFSHVAEKSDTGSDKIKRNVAELYVEKMQLNLNYI